MPPKPNVVTLSGGHFGGTTARPTDDVFVLIDEAGGEWVYSRLRSPHPATADFIGMKADADVTWWLTPDEQKAAASGLR